MTTKPWTIDVGRYETGERIVIPVPGYEGAHLVAAGSSGSGKTWFIKLVLAKLARQFGAHIAFVVIDPHLVNYKAFVPRVSMIAYGHERGLTALEMVENFMHGRYRLMFEKGIEEWSPKVAKILGPYLIVVVEELAAITLAPKPAQPTAAERREGMQPVPSAEIRLISLAQQMRKIGGGLILATQSPKVAVISNLVLEQCPIRWCGRTRGPEQTKAVLESHEYPCHQPNHPKGIPFEMKGGCYVDDGRHIRRGRTDGIKPDVFARIAQETAADRFDLGWPHEIHPIQLAAAKGGNKTWE